MPGIAQQLLLQHNKLHSLIESMQLFGRDEAGSERAMELISNFSELMRRHLAFESRQLSLRTLDAGAAKDFEAHVRAAAAQLDAAMASAAAAPQQTLDAIAARLTELLADHVAQASHRKLLPHS